MGGLPLSLYLHIPFCTLKCRYCDFNSYAGIGELMGPFVDALCAEIGLWGTSLRGRSVDTIFFGGGTPSLLPLEHLERIVAALRSSFEIDPEAEVTLEANPGTVDGAYLRGLLSLGVNRISFGVQSFHDDELAALDRIHTAAEAKRCYVWAREAGFRRVNLDLIYGLPEPSSGMERWQDTLEQAIEMQPEHLSLYALTVEDGTKLAYDIDRGAVAAPDPDTQAEMYEWSARRLEEAGYSQYEISNWCLAGEECRHNLVYWRNGDWLGFGPGAHSHLRTANGREAHRFANVYSPRRYVERVKETVVRGVRASGEMGELLGSMRQVCFVEPQPLELQMADTAILALRLNEGLDEEGFSQRFGISLQALYGEPLAELCGLGLLERQNGRLRLTDRGRLLANEVFVRLLP
jgi:oxygen-independent coproporphyrinogen-3 oxidase